MMCPICYFDVEKNKYDELYYCKVCNKEFNKSEVINSD